MAQSDSEDENLDGLEYDGDDDPDAEVDNEDEPLDMAPDDVTEEGDDESVSEDSEDGSDEDEDDEEEPFGETLMDLDASVEPTPASPPPPPPPPELPSPSTRRRSLSPAQLRKNALVPSPGSLASGSYSIEAICAIPHPVPTHALASSFCMTHLLTGSDDGYIRDYDIFAAVNSKNFLTAPQRSHSGVVEGLMKSGQLRFWWENPALPDPTKLGVLGEDVPSLSPVYSLAMHSDALWTLAGTDTGHINLFTVRHEPGRLCHTMNGHRGPVAALSMDYNEKGFFSAGWDGEAIQWDLNNGQRVRNFTSHGAQLAAIAVRPLNSGYVEEASPVITRRDGETTQPSTQTASDTTMASTNATTASSETIKTEDSQAPLDSDAKSDASFDPLFDDEPEAPERKLVNGNQPVALPTTSASTTQQNQPASRRATVGQIPPPKNAPPLLDSNSYATYSPDLLMTASIDGQVILWDRRVNTPGQGVGRLWMSEKTPPWCLSACWSADGGQVYAGRRNGTVDVWDVRQLGRSGPTNTPRLLKTLRNPLSSGVVSCVVAFPDCRHIACASIDNLRLWNVAEAAEPDASGRVKSGVQFKIIPGHHGGYISQMLVDPAARFLVSASSNRGWHGESTRTVFVHDVKRAQ
ncbi:Transcription factor SPT8 [Hypsizygus marmoreus]|uniref:Transcription factor SPT8 n=1 Tax=Hypsizygus marmoreus TaxID=39966 RepID=A0A369JGY1_HYPMA|nr:Transcription factor SPT8 [Hypsizygus marmoreus]